MQVLVKINSVNKASALVESSLVAESILTQRISTCYFELEGEHTINEGADEVIISNVAETTRYFAGYIMYVERAVRGLTKVAKCECQDYSILLDKRIVNEVYENKTDAYIINDLFTEYLPEINATTYVVEGETHPRIVFNRLTLRQVLELLSDISGLDWRVDYNKNLHYFVETTNVAPFDISDSPDESTSFACSNFNYRRDARPIVNRVTVVGGYYFSDDTNFELAGNAQTKELALPYKVHSQAAETSVKIYRNDGNDTTPSWTQLGVGVDYIDTLGGAIDVLFNYNEKLLKFNTAPPNLKRAIKIECRYEVPILLQVKSDASYTQYGHWFDGLVVNKDLENRDEAKLVGKGVIAERAFTQEQGSYTIDAHDGLVAGQRQKITNAPRGLNAYYYLINNVTWRILGADKCQYQVSFGAYNPDLIDLILRIKNASAATSHRREDEALTTIEILNEVLEQEETLAFSEGTDYHSDSFVSGLVNRWIALPTAQAVGHNVEHEKVTLGESTNQTSHAKNNYLWDSFYWDYATWG